MEIEAFEPSSASSGSMQIEAFEPVVTSADAGLGVVELVGSFDDPAAHASPAEQPTVKFYGLASGTASLDTRFDSPHGAALGENVAEARFRTMVGLDAKLSSRVRVVVEGRAQVRLVTQRDFERAKGLFEPMLGDAYLDFYSSNVDVRIGNQRVALGANAALAPSDALNPRDLRESPMLAEPEDAVLPVFAIRAQGEWRGLSWLVAYTPFFTPNRYAVFGQDESLLQPGLGPVLDNTRLDPSIEDAVQERLLETRRPMPFAGDVALRLKRDGSVKLGASWVWANEKMPRFRMDSELASMLASQAAGRTVDSAQAVSVLNRAQAGETLTTGTYGRTHVFSLEGSTIVGPGQLDVDVAFSPRSSFIDREMNPIDKSALTWVVGFSQAAQSPIFYSIAYMGLAVPDIGSAQQLLFIEPATAFGAPHTAFLHVFSGLVSVPLIRDKLEVSLRAAFEPIQLSFALGPRLTWLGFERVKVWVSGEVYEGASWSPLGYYHRNDKVLVGARVDL